jgi:hypothetical protein
MATSLYDNETERKQHLSSILHLSRELACPVEEVMGLYESELGKLKEVARVKDFLGVFTTRRVREVIREQHS